MKTVVLLADGFEEVEALTPIDFLRRADIEVILAGVTGRDVVGSHDVRLNTDITLDDLSGEFESVIAPGGMPGAENLAASGQTVDLIRKVFREGGLVASICAAPALVLFKAGVLEGRDFTCHPAFVSRVTAGNNRQTRVCRDGNLITAAGVGMAAEFAIEIIDYLLGKEKAEEMYKKTFQLYPRE